jgi:hypothetical protein
MNPLDDLVSDLNQDIDLNPTVPTLSVSSPTADAKQAKQTEESVSNPKPAWKNFVQQHWLLILIGVLVCLLFLFLGMNVRSQPVNYYPSLYDDRGIRVSRYKANTSRVTPHKRRRVTEAQFV